MPSTSVCLMCLIGLPASGKSTLARKIEAHYNNKYDIDLVSFDEEILLLEGITWKAKRHSINKVVVSRIENHLKFKNKETIVILDDNMFYRSMRYEYLKLARRFELGFCQVFVSTPLHKCLELNDKRIYPIDKSIIIKMNRMMEIPKPEANHWETNSIVLTHLLDEPEWIILEKLIKHCLEKPFKPITKSFPGNNALSRVHLADIALRKLVGDLVKKKKETHGNLKLYIEQLAVKRLQVLDRVRNKEIILSQTTSDSIEAYAEQLMPFLFQK